MEGMRGFVRATAPSSTRRARAFVALECVGSPHLILIEGEGMLRMRDYDASLREELQAAADEAGVRAVARTAPRRRRHRRAAGAACRLPRGVHRGVHRAEGAGELPLAERRAGEPLLADDRAGRDRRRVADPPRRARRRLSARRRAPGDGRASG